MILNSIYFHPEQHSAFDGNVFQFFNWLAKKLTSNVPGLPQVPALIGKPVSWVYKPLG